MLGTKPVDRPGNLRQPTPSFREEPPGAATTASNECRRRVIDPSARSLTCRTHVEVEASSLERGSSSPLLLPRASSSSASELCAESEQSSALSGSIRGPHGARHSKCKRNPSPDTCGWRRCE
jgi:hypothetical protein